MLTESSIKIRSSDHHQFDAFTVAPDESPKAGLVVIQEIFGVTEHMKNIARYYAEQGYHTIVPALFDRVAERNTLIPYSETDKGRSLAEQCRQDEVLRDIQAAADTVKTNGHL